MQRSQHSFHAAVVPCHGEHPLRNPWVDKHHDSSSSSASRSGRRYGQVRQPHAQTRPGPPPASEWLRPPQRMPYNPHPNLHSHCQIAIPPATRLSHHGSSPAESALAVTNGTGSCGGQCAAFDVFCYHCLQVFYITGILTGISLTIAGSVLRSSPHRGDLLVLVYIGVLLSAVCTLLLCVQYCVRRGVKDRKRALRTPRQPLQVPPSPIESIPMQIYPTEIIPLRQPPSFIPPDLTAEDLRHFRNVPTVSRSRSTHSSHGRRYYLQEERPIDEWERQPYQPLLHRPR